MVYELPDGSAFGEMVLPLPADHWLTRNGENVPPMPWRVGNGEARQRMAAAVQAAAQYAIRAATMNGKEPDFDPDAMCQNMIVGLLGYWTDDGCSGDPWANPTPLPALVMTEPRP